LEKKYLARSGGIFSAHPLLIRTGEEDYTEMGEKERVGDCRRVELCNQNKKFHRVAEGNDLWSEKKPGRGGKGEGMGGEHGEGKIYKSDGGREKFDLRASEKKGEGR